MEATDTGAAQEAAGRTGGPLLGRERELAQLSAALEESRAGRGQLVTLAGEAGIGKTRLAEALADRAEAASIRVLWGRCWDSGGAPAFWPWMQLLRGLLRDRDDERLRAELGSGGGWVAQIIPELRDRLPDLEPPGSLDSEQARFALFDAITSFLRSASAGDPLLIVLDDVHAADQASLLLLRFVARSVQEEPLLALALYREGAVRQRPEVEKLIAGVARDSRTIRLGPFGEKELAHMLEHRGGRRAAPELVRALREASEGNPFFADELARLAAAEGWLELREGETARARLPLPDTVRDTIRRRLEPLGEESLEVLGAAAVIGREFRLSTLQRVTRAERERLIELLDQAVRHELLAPVPAVVGRFRFTHGLIAETLYAQLGPIDRIRLHRAVGEALEEVEASDPEHLPELAHHFAEAAAAGDPAKAVEYATRAGEHALERILAYEQAAEMFNLALTVSELDPDQDKRAYLLLRLGQARTRADDPAARATLIAASDAARAVGRADLLAEAALAVHLFALGPGVVDDALVELLEEALEQVGPDDSPLRARLLARLAVTLYYAPETAEQREALVEQATAMARRLGDPRTLAYALANAQLATWGPETAERNLAHGDELLQLTGRVGAFLARNRQIDLLIELDDLVGAGMAIEELARLEERSPDPRAAAYLALQRARRALIEGRYADAERLNAEAAAVGARLRDPVIRILVAAQQFGIRWSQGRVGEVEEVTRRIADSSAAMPGWRAGLAVAYCALGRESEARRELERLAADGFANTKRYDAWTVTLTMLAEVCAQLGDSDRAGELYELLLPVAGRNVISLHANYLGPVSRFLGILATTRGDWDAAARHFEEAEGSAARQGARPIRALLRLDEARMLAARNAPGDRERGLELLAEAEAIADDLGSEKIVERAEGMRAPLAGAEASEPRAPVRPASARPTAALLRREGDVWAFDYEERVLRVRDSKGMRYLATLLSSPGVEIHAVDLVGPERGRGDVGADAAAAAAAAAGLAVRGLGEEDAGPVLDAQAKAAYRDRLEELREELEEAEAWADPERAVRAREEMDLLAQELSGAVGLGGRDRKAASSAERARVNATRAIRATLKRIAEHDPVLGRELEATVRTGTFCAYEPDPRNPLAWKVEES